MGICTLHHESADVDTIGIRKNTGIYGIARLSWSNQTTPQWVRTDDSEFFTATASVDSTAGQSDFDDIYPWSEMKRTTFTTGDVMVYIPEFYYQRTVEDNVERIRISATARDGFELHPGSGKYVGAYHTSAGYKSVSGATPLGNTTREVFRTNVMAKGDGWYAWSLHILSAIQMLYLVEFANNYSQSVIGPSTTARQPVTGSCDNIPNLTGRSTSPLAVIYRGIENLWGGMWQFLDGIMFNGTAIMICDDPQKFASSVTSDYYQLSYTISTGGFWIAGEGYDPDHPWAMIPATGGAGETTGYTDWCYRTSGLTGVSAGGSDVGTAAGMFAIAANVDLTYVRNDYTVRLVCDHAA